MKYETWVQTYVDNVRGVITKLGDKPMEDIVDYFDYDNMAKNEQGFCPLYRDFTKCHVTNKLNCLLCACPHFRYSSDEPLEVTPDGKRIMSICSISSKQAGTFEVDNVVHCDCSKCHIPHSKQHTHKHIKDNNIQDGYSLLELIRNYQMSSCFGKYNIV